MNHKFLDLLHTYKSINSDLDEAYQRVISSGQYIGSYEVENFERQFSEYCNTSYCIGVGNGLDALILSLRALNIGHGDEVIVPANTFIATWLAVVHVGAKPVPVDADELTMNIDVTKIEEAINKRTKAIIVVHLYGNPVDMDKITKISCRYGIDIIEDAAQAHGAKFENKITGSLGKVAAFSFYPGKNLGGFGDGGAVLTNDLSYAQHIQSLRNYGSKVKYNHEHIGYNSRLDPIQAAFLSVKLKFLDEWNHHRSQIAAIYFRNLSSSHTITLPKINKNSLSAWHLFVIRHPQRDKLHDYLKTLGVETALHYPIPNHQSKAFNSHFKGAHFPVTEKICKTCLSIPIGPHISLAAAEEISNLINMAAEKTQ